MIYLEHPQIHRIQYTPRVHHALPPQQQHVCVFVCVFVRVCVGVRGREWEGVALQWTIAFSFSPHLVTDKPPMHPTNCVGILSHSLVRAPPQLALPLCHRAIYTIVHVPPIQELSPLGA